MLAFTLPDHGEEWPGMGDAWSEHPSWELVEAASDAAHVDVAALLHEGARGALRGVANAHLATFVLSLVALDAAERVGLAPMALAGFGLGEYTALAAAGAIGFEEGVQLVQRRGEAVATAVRDVPCAAAVVGGLADGDVEAACARAEDDVWVAAYDAAQLVTIGGTHEGVERAVALARSMGATSIERVDDATGLHTPLLGGAREVLRKALAEVQFTEPDPVVVANVDARHHLDPTEWPGLLSAQLCAPVRWRQTVESLFAEGVRTFVEFGTGATLADHTRLSFPTRAVQTHLVASPSDLEALVERLISTPSAGRRAGSAHDHLVSRMVVSPAAGPFRPVDDLAYAAPRLAGIGPEPDGDGTPEVTVKVGDLLGWVADVEVRSAFEGSLGGLLVIAGERVMPSQPVAWLRVGADA